MNILLIGSGGREHAFAWKLAQSPLCTQLFVAPGNAGTASLATNLPISVIDFPALGAAVVKHDIHLIIVGPEEPLVRGIRDYFRANEAFQHVLIVGPDSHGAMLEGSKDFSKNFMQQYGIPTAGSRTFTRENIADGLVHINTLPIPVVLKADGLAGGKGVVIAQSHAEARQTLEEMLIQAKFGEASNKVVIEDFLAGIELSVFILTDGEEYVLLPEAKDYKRIGEGDTGPNTGGMGAVSPVPYADGAFMRKVTEKVIKPTLAGLKAEGIHYVGFIFIGLMNVNGEPFVIEYNCRMGDPETEAVLPRIDSDLVLLLRAAAEGKLGYANYTVSEKTAVTTVLVSGGYPGEFSKGFTIQLSEKQKVSTVFHAGTIQDSGELRTNGGRVLAVTALGNSIEEARRLSQQTAEEITYEGKYYRKDIGLDLL